MKKEKRSDGKTVSGQSGASSNTDSAEIFDPDSPPLRVICFHKSAPLAAALAIIAYVLVLFYPAFRESALIAPLDISSRMLAPWKSESAGAKPHNHYVVDAVTQYLPYRVFAEKSFRQDGYIGWNPYEMGGYSLAANTMATPASWSVQLHRFMPFKDAWNFGIITEFAIAGFGMLAFLRLRNLPWIPCILGATAYMASSQFVIWIYHRWALGSFCWMPWVLWSSASGFTRNKPTLRQFLLPVFITLAILGGSLQHLAFVVIACGCIFIGGIENLRKPSNTLAPFIAWTVAFVLAIGASSFTLVPQIQGYFANLATGNTRGTLGYEAGLTQPLCQALLIPVQVWPWLIGDPQSLDGTRLFKCGFMDIAYMGTLPMLMAIVGLFRKHTPKQAKWLIAVGLLIPLTPLVGPLYHRVQLVFLLGGAWMAAEMLATIPLAPPRRAMNCLSACVAILGVFLLAAALIPSPLRKTFEQQVTAKAISVGTRSSFEPEKEWLERRAKNWTQRISIGHPVTAGFFGLLVLGTTGLALASKPGKTEISGGRLMILGVTSIELLAFFRIWTTFSDIREFLPECQLVEEVRNQAGSHRVLQRVPGMGFSNLFATPNILAAYGVPSVDSYESIQHRFRMTVLSGVADDVRLSLAGVGTIVRPIGSPQAKGTENWTHLKTSGGYEILENPEVPAPVSAGTGRIPTSPGEIAEILKTSIAVKPALQTMNRWKFKVPSASTWLRISQNWHEGWKWRSPGGNWRSFLNGPDAACWIANPPSDELGIEVRFFPRWSWLEIVSYGSVLLWACGIPMIRFHNPALRPAGADS